MEIGAQPSDVLEDDDMGMPTVGELWRMLVRNQQQMIIFQQQQLDFQNKTTAKLDAIKDILSQAKGGWKVFIAIGSVFGTVVAGIAYILNHLKIPPFH